MSSDCVRYCLAVLLGLALLPSGVDGATSTDGICDCGAFPVDSNCTPYVGTATAPTAFPGGTTIYCPAAPSSVPWASFGLSGPSDASIVYAVPSSQPASGSQGDPV